MDIADDLPMHAWLKLSDAEQWDILLSYLTPEQRDRQLYGHCKQGHALTPQNSYPRPNGTRMCKLCHKERDRIRNANRDTD